MPALLTHIDRDIDCVIGDGTYDQKPVCAAVGRNAPGARVVIPPRKDAVVRPKGAPSPSQRAQHIVEIERLWRVLGIVMLDHAALDRAAELYAEL